MMENTVSDNLQLLSLWRKAVNEESTTCGFNEWVQLYHPALANVELCDPPPAYWRAVQAATEQDIRTLAARLDDLERNGMSPFTITAMIEQRIHDALIRAAGAVQP